MTKLSKFAIKSKNLKDISTTMTNAELHPIFSNSTLSDHIKQIADFKIHNQTIRIVSHNMLNKCHAGTYPDNAWNYY